MTVTESFKERLTALLLKRKLVNQGQLDKALSLQKERGHSLSQILVEEAYVSEKDLLSVLSQELEIPPIDLSRFKIEQEIARLIPERIARQYHLIPISKIGTTLVIAMSDPLNIFAIDDLRMVTHYQVDPVLSTDKDIVAAIDRTYSGSPQEKFTKILEGSQEGSAAAGLLTEEELDLEAIAKAPEKVPVVEVVNLILLEAISKRASDIHLEPEEDALRIRYRIDGNLGVALRLPKKVQGGVVSRLKIIAGLDITESRLPQDGRFRIRYSGREIDFRVSVLPISFGGKIVLRILDRSTLPTGLQGLGFSPQGLAELGEAIQKPFGMILVTGPTGSGKSTTLYSILQKLNQPERNITTIEDPVEYQINGITQIQVNPEIGLTFATGLRAIMRQSPDIIMVGEIRDFETADIAVKAALTGHLLFSTLHTNDAPSAVTRLMDMGVEPYLIASSVNLVGAQRLCRRICPNCREKDPVSPALLKELGVSAKGDLKFYKGRGCRRCAQSGYLGRMGILEVMVMEEGVRDLILRRVSTSQIRDYVKTKGFKTLREDALEKCLQGVTSIEELFRMTVEEE